MLVAYPSVGLEKRPSECLPGGTGTITSNFTGTARLWCHPYSALSGIALERGFKGGLHLGTVSVYVITLGFTLCLVLAVKAGQHRVTCPPSLAELRVSRRCSLIKSCLMTYPRIEETS